MADGMLTQEEIDALLSGAAFDAPAAPAAKSAPTTVSAPASPTVKTSAAPLSGDELKGLGEKLNYGFGSAGEVTATLLGRSIRFAPISVDTEDDDGISAMLAPENALFDFTVSGAATGAACLALPVPDAALFADLLMGGAGTGAGSTMDELHQSAAKEAAASLLNGLWSAIARETSKNFSTSPVTIEISSSAPLSGSGRRVIAQYSFEIEGLRGGTVALVMENGVARAISGVAAAPQAAPRKSAPPAAASRPAVNVQQVAFPSLTPAASEAQIKNIDILMDVPMQVTVELGRASMMIRDILELGTGSIIELDKLAGEPVDLLVNSRLIARGEVVVIDENFGVRVTDIISPMERIKNLQ